MNDLTEQWKKGELEEGFYYVKCPWSDEIEVRYVHNGTDEYECIVAPVPSYEKWEKFRNALADNQIENSSLLIEKVKLKELLKECRDHLITYKRDNIDKGYVVYDGSYLIDEINQALGED